MSRNNQRAWTMPELKRVAGERQAGLSFAAIAETHDRTVSSIKQALQRNGYNGRSDHLPRYCPTHHQLAAALKRGQDDLAWELARARAERDSAPLLRSWPEGTWN